MFETVFLRFVYKAQGYSMSRLSGVSKASRLTTQWSEGLSRIECLEANPDAAGYGI
jgi:hypothetical protein